LAEAAIANQLGRALGRWERLDLDELGYVPLAETACELMFQVTADRAERAAVIGTTNLPFSEWSQAIPNPRLFKALVDSADGPGAHHHHRRRLLSVPPHRCAARGPPMTMRKD
jgi:DNA replication protein DnaC